MNVGPGVSVFDAIETDDNEFLGWEEFLQFFEERHGEFSHTGHLTKGWG